LFVKLVSERIKASSNSNSEKKKIENYFFMTDGNTEYKTSSVETLIRKMNGTKKEKIGGVCGRIVPKGSDFLASYQVF
jgi:hypothetical protein